MTQQRTIVLVLALLGGIFCGIGWTHIGGVLLAVALALLAA